MTFNPSGVPYGDISPFGLCYQYTSPLGHGKIHYDIIFSKDNRVEYYSVDNGVLLAFISITGEILMLRDLRIEPPRDIIKRGESGNRLIIYDDIPFYWDAWDIMPYYAMTGRSVNGAKTGSADINLFTHRVDISHLPDKLVLVFGYNAFESEWSKSIESFDTGSPYKLSYELKCTILSNDPLIEFDLTCDWHESHKLLKVDFPLNVRAATAKYDMQYGFVERPTHRNQDTDAAMFEVCGHKYADLSEVDYGVALINNCKYGYSALDSTLSLSLLRSPKSPDPLCDMGRHHMRYAILPHGTTGSGGGLCDVVAAATRFNSSLKNVGVEPYLVDGPSHLTLLNNSLVTVSAFNGLRASTLILDTIKVTESFIDALTEDWRDATGPNNTIVLRFYESVGSKGRATVTTTCGLKFQAVCLCDSFEDIQRETSNKESVLCEITEDCFQINYTSFQIITIAVTFLLK